MYAEIVLGELINHSTASDFELTSGEIRAVRCDGGVANTNIMVNRRVFIRAIPEQVCIMY